jgi:hypothetical protein
MLTDLKRGLSKSGFDGFYVSEFSPFASNKPKPINRETVMKMFEARLQNYNIWEETRIDRSRLIDMEEKWLTN